MKFKSLGAIILSLSLLYCSGDNIEKKVKVESNEQKTYVIEISKEKLYEENETKAEWMKLVESVMKKSDVVENYVFTRTTACVNAYLFSYKDESGFSRLVKDNENMRNIIIENCYKLILKDVLYEYLKANKGDKGKNEK